MKLKPACRTHREDRLCKGGKVEVIEADGPMGRWSLKSRVQGPGFRVEYSGFRVQGDAVGQTKVPRSFSHLQIGQRAQPVLLQP